jgi:hypothetical protein
MRRTHVGEHYIFHKHGERGSKEGDVLRSAAGLGSLGKQTVTQVASLSRQLLQRMYDALSPCLVRAGGSFELRNLILSERYMEVCKLSNEHCN